MAREREGATAAAAAHAAEVAALRAAHGESTSAAAAAAAPITDLSVMGVPGPLFSFAPKTAAVAGSMQKPLWRGSVRRR